MGAEERPPSSPSQHSLSRLEEADKSDQEPTLFLASPVLKGTEESSSHTRRVWSLQFLLARLQPCQAPPPSH